MPAFHPFPDIVTRVASLPAHERIELLGPWPKSVLSREHVGYVLPDRLGEGRIVVAQD